MSIFQLLNINELSPFPFIISVLAPLLLFFLIAKKCFFSNRNLPPSPPKLPVLGHLHLLDKFPHKNLQALAKKHGPYMLLHLGSRPTLVVSSASAAEEIMKTHDLTFSDRDQSNINMRLLYECKDVSVAPYGEYWRQLKSICVLQLLSNKRVQSFHSIRVEETALLFDKIRNSDGPVNLSEMFIDLTNDLVCRSAFGKKYREGEIGKKFLKMLCEFVGLLGYISIGDYVTWLWWINSVNGFNARVDKVAKELDNFLEGVIREHMERDHQDSKDGNSRENFLDILLDVYHNQKNGTGTGVPIDWDSIKSTILVVFAGGTDTTANVLEWGMSELMKHPNIMKKLQDEIRGIVKDRQDITPEDLEKMHFLKAVIKETLRCHTPIPLLIPRIARNDVKINGYDIAAGTMAMVNAWAISRDPAYWDEPEVFKPERFLDSSIDYKGQDFEFTPFGTGRRGCPGISFAIATEEFVLANMVHKFDWKLPNGVEGKDLDMSERPALTIHRAVPLRVVATERY